MCSGGGGGPDPTTDLHRDGFYRNDLHPESRRLYPKTSKPSWEMTRHRWGVVAAAILTAGLTVTTACMSPPDDDDRPGGTGTSIGGHDCAELDTTVPRDCED